MSRNSGFPPVYDSLSRILILGSFPSVRSRAEGFYYAHPQNRFWRVLSVIFDTDIPKSIAEKREFLLARHIALWDAAESCEADGSSDASVREVVPTDVAGLLARTDIGRIFANGKTAEKLYRRYSYPKTHMAITALPSTSPANAAWTAERLAEAWRIILREVKQDA